MRETNLQLAVLYLAKSPQGFESLAPSSPRISWRPIDRDLHVTDTVLVCCISILLLFIVTFVVRLRRRAGSNQKQVRSALRGTTKGN